MALLSDRESFDRAAMRKVEKDWQRIGELVQGLVSVGQLRLGDDGMHNTGYFVMLSDGPTHIVKKDESLLDALESVWATVAYWTED